MNLKQLVYFVTVIEEGTISAAAKKLYVGQPLVSYQIKTLEEEFGLQLLRRGARHTTMTEAGAAFYERARHILGLTEVTQKMMADMKAGLKGTLYIGAKCTSASVLLNPSVVSFYKTHPDIQIIVQYGRTFELINSLLEGIVEVAVVHLPFEQVSGIAHLPLPKEHILAVGTCAFLPDAPSLSISALEQVPLIIHKSLIPKIEEACSAAGFAPRIYCITEDARTSLMWANAEVGVAIVPHSNAEVVALREQMRLLLVTGEHMQTQSALIWRSDAPLSPLAQSFLDVFTQ